MEKMKINITIEQIGNGWILRLESHSTFLDLTLPMYFETLKAVLKYLKTHPKLQRS